MSELALHLIFKAKETRAIHLDLGNCGLIELPEELFELTWLEELNLASEAYFFDSSKNKLVFFKTQNIGKTNNLMRFPTDIQKLANLKILFACGSNIRWSLSDLSPLKKLLNLIQLDLSNTSLSDNWLGISTLEPLEGMKNLVSLNVSNTKIQNLAPLSDKIKLIHLDLSNTPVNSFHKLLGKYDQLRMLNIAHTNILYGDLLFLRKCINLKHVNISHTRTESLYSLRNLLNLEEIIIDGCPLNDPPREIAEQGIAAIHNYFNQIKVQGGKVTLYEAKLILVGEGGTGKTTLFEKLKDKDYQVGNTPETHGINIYEGLPFRHPFIGENIFYANIWDFGGQELQYMTHQFFLTPRALYVLMMDARRESPNLAYWFKIISLLGRHSEDSREKVRLLLVFNKRGNTMGIPPQYQDQLKYYENNLEVQYLEVDLAENDYRFDNLQHAIQKNLVTLPIVKSQLPRLWKVVREDLRKTAKTENYIDTKYFSVICSKHGITEEADQWLLSGYLHQLGSLLHFQNDKGLRRLVILSPQWATDGVYIFLSEPSIIQNKGRFSEATFIKLLATKKYSRDDADVILQLMTKKNFDICYEATTGNYVAAQLLPDNAPNYNWFPRDVLQFRYQYPIMPKGLMSRLIVRLSEDIENNEDTGEQVVWKKGVVLAINLKEGRCRVRLREDDAESKSGLRQILIDVMGAREARKYALRKIRESVEDLHEKWFRSIKSDEMVSCCCSECTTSDTPQLYKLENIIKIRSKGTTIPIRCYNSAEEVFTQDLLEGVYDKNEILEKDSFNKFGGSKIL